MPAARMDILWPEKSDVSFDVGKQSYVIGWRVKDCLICVATVLPMAECGASKLEQEVASLSKRFGSRSNENSSPLTVLGTISPPQVHANTPAYNGRPFWVDMAWNSDHLRPVVRQIRKHGNPCTVAMCHIVLYDATFSRLQRYRHLTIRKRKRSGASDTNEAMSPTPLQTAIFHLNHSSDIEQCLLGNSRRDPPSFLSKLQSMLCWPFVLMFMLCRPACHFFMCLLSVRFPSRMPLYGGHHVKSLSLFLRLLNRRVAMVATIAEQYVKFNREYYSDTPFHVLESGYAEYMSDLAFFVLDLVGGYLYRSVVPTGIVYFQQSSHSHFRTLKAQVTWLVDAPAGFKINVALASSLVKGIHLMVDVAQYAIDGLSPYVGTMLWVASAASVLGLSVQLGLLYDFVEFGTMQTYYLYLYFSKLHRVQFDLLSSLWRLFLGKKKNLLRNRVDSCEYDVTQMLVGTLLFTILFFVVATNSVFYLYFCLVRCVVLAIQTTLWCAIVFSQTIPLYSVALWLQDKFQFPADVYVRPVRLADALSIAFPNVHKSNCFVDDDFAPTEPASFNYGATIPTAYFTMHPVAQSFGSLFTRVSEYSGALAEHYTVGKFLRCFLLGEYIPALAFDDTPMRMDESTSMSSLTTAQLYEALRACRWE
ncbi:hypothetical protein H310_06836 [Aphanomyces invadans]|uniref:Phosphatidylinositol N-acetylglucosaminyltransferase subunit Q n=1 Tax=Aphanomyces invadans TaxID=157072 RepID=A0A024U6L6_9STRA|nr:hypothetical protein H310_06836 [Aphanomyces invadans]ETW01258.1 hypothetical protein H310_06836 [Aphanomyces invadans]|eukprot:XP_008870256.1 hypothetical protein H310_06836 [Aphanomyces invadans]